MLTESVAQSSDGHSIDFQLKSIANGVTLQAVLYSLIDGQVVRLKVNEINAVRPRFEPKQVLLEDIPLSKLTLTSQTADGFDVKLADTRNRVSVKANPLRIDVFSDDKLVISGNQRGLFKFEHYRPKVAGILSLLRQLEPILRHFSLRLTSNLISKYNYLLFNQLNV